MLYFSFVAAFIFISSPLSRCQYPALHPGRYASILLILSYATCRAFIFFLTYTATVFQSPSRRHRVTGEMLVVNPQIQIGINSHHPGKDHPIHCKSAIITTRNIIICLDTMATPIRSLDFSSTQEHRNTVEHDSISSLLKPETVPTMAGCCRIQPLPKSRRP